MSKILIGVIVFISLFISCQTALAAPDPIVTFTFDDATISQYEYAAPIIKTFGQKATLYVPTLLVGTEGYMTWQDIVNVVVDGWEVGGHSSSHQELTLLTPEQIQQEIEENFAILESHGLFPIDFATPYGAYDPIVLAEVSSYFASHRAFHDIGYNAWPYNKYLLYAQQVNNQTTLAEVDAWIQEATANNYWLIIVFHDILPTVDPADTYSWTTENLQNLMTLLDTYGIKTKTVAEALNMKGSLFPNSDFSNGIADGWTTDTPEQVITDMTGKGAVPTPDSSIKMIGGDVPAYLFSPSVPVLSSIEYGVRVFTNTVNLISGEFGFYVDEYDINNNWLSWKFLGIATLNNIIDESYPYQPTSELVSSVSLRSYLAAGSVGEVFIDNASLFEIGEGDPLPIPNPTIIQQLPLLNGDFSEGLSYGWIGSNGQVTAESEQIKMTGGDTATHLFSSKFLIDPQDSYEASVFADTMGLTVGEVGIYFDEYDLSGTWISGQWLGSTSLNMSDNFSFFYSPSSETVYSSSFQVYMTGGSTGQAFIDNIGIEVTDPSASLIELPLPNSDFSAGIAEGWTTNNPVQVTAESEQIKMTGGDKAAHLFSPKFLIDSAQAYEVSSLINAVSLSTGEVGLYFDEYGTGGNWISGKWLGSMPLGQTGVFSLPYTPTSTLVSSGSLQVYMILGSEGEVFVDDAQVSIVAPLPDGWTTDNLLQATAEGEGVKITGGELAVHLFGPKIAVDPALVHEVSSLINAVSLSTGEVGLYLDEYDASNAWISGKWLGLAPLGETGILSFSYIPSSGTVSSASLQVYMIAGSEGEVFVDNAGITLGIPPIFPIELPLPNSDFSNGIADGWTTNDIVNVIAEQEQIKMIGAETDTGNAVYLFSPKFLINPTQMYKISGMINTESLSLGEVGIYFDEYNVNGEWVSGKQLGSAELGVASNLNLFYTPTSDTVYSASLQVYMTANSVGEALVDDMEVNLVIPLPDGWTTDNFLQATAEGETVKMTGGNLAVSLFGPKVAIDSVLTYEVSSLIDTVSLNSGEVGFYLDEYDINDIWISGKWLGLAPLGQKNTLSFSYIPSSGTVSFGALQVYMTIASNGEVLIDSPAINVAE